MEKARFIERMLETENLTDELEDSDANWLLNWGIQRLDEVLAGTSDEETAGAKVNALMAVMRKINRIAGTYTYKDTQELAGDLAALSGLFAAAFGSTEPQTEEVNTAEFEAAAVRLAGLPISLVVETLTQRPATPSSPASA